LIWENAWSKKDKALEMWIQVIEWRNIIKESFPFLNSLTVSAPKKQAPQISQQSLF
jgi:hypothetical protein